MTPSCSATAVNKTGRRVSFNERVRCKFTVHHSSFSEEEREAVWITKEETTASRDEIRVTLEAIQTGQLPMQRGLEFRTKTAAKRRVTIKNKARAVVLDEQAEQRVAGRTDDEAVARLYAEFSENSQRQAELRALMDEQVARQLYDDDDDDNDVDERDDEYAVAFGKSLDDSDDETASTCSTSTGRPQAPEEDDSFPTPPPTVNQRKHIVTGTRLSKLDRGSESVSSARRKQQQQQQQQQLNGDSDSVAASVSSSKSLPSKLRKSLKAPMRLFVGSSAA